MSFEHRHGATRPGCTQLVFVFCSCGCVCCLCVPTAHTVGNFSRRERCCVRSGGSCGSGSGHIEIDVLMVVEFALYLFYIIYSFTHIP